MAITYENNQLFVWVKKMVNYNFKKDVYYNNRFITGRRYHIILVKGYLRMLQNIESGQEYPTWG